MPDIQAEMSEFILQNKRVSYFDYMNYNNGIDPEKREQKINNLIIYLLKGYVYIYSMAFGEPDEKQILIFHIIEAIVVEEKTEEEKIKEIKQILFVKDKNIYQAAIDVIESTKMQVELMTQDLYLTEMINLVIEHEKTAKTLQSAASCLGYVYDENNRGETRKITLN